MGEGGNIYTPQSSQAWASEFENSHEDKTLEERKLAHLRPLWTTLYKHTLPALARSKAPSQPHWPVHLDHCFARIILDAVIGNSTNSSAVTRVPWTDRIDAPAIKNMAPRQLEDCIELGEAIAEGKVNLVELDRSSLAARGKTKGGKRKLEQGEAQDAAASKKQKKTLSSTPKPPKSQLDIRKALNLHLPPSNHPPSPPPPQPATVIDPTLSSKIHLHPTLTPFRKRVLLALCQVPPGHYTTYLALSNHLSSSPRAVGNALRSNPFAPAAPCHRVVAAGGGIGGFGGEWGVTGKFNGEKVGLLRREGVDVDAEGGRVRGVVWEGFV